MCCCFCNGINDTSRHAGIVLNPRARANRRVEVGCALFAGYGMQNQIEMCLYLTAYPLIVSRPSVLVYIMQSRV